MNAHLHEPQYLTAPEAGGFAPAEEPRQAVYVYPGQVFVSAKPARVTTILGSCIAVCLFDVGRRVGGMNHFMLPHFAGNGVASARFGNLAMEELLAKLAAAGARIPHLQARVFGGSCMFESMAGAGHLGKKNEAFAAETLAARHIRVLETDTGGNRGRKLVFHTDEGKAWLTSI
jgi:chemotaxis protein CheD